MFLGDAKAALLVSLGLQVESQQEVDPSRRFFELLSPAMASGKAHVADREGNAPECPSAWGWRLSDEGRTEGESWQPSGDSSPYWIAGGERIGWVDGEDLYLEPNAVILLVQRMSGEEGFALSPRSLRRRLKEGGYLRGLSAARETTSTRVTLAGARRSVLHMGQDALLTC